MVLLASLLHPCPTVAVRQEKNWARARLELPKLNLDSWCCMHGDDLDNSVVRASESARSLGPASEPTRARLRSL